jgi:hypothetical protein
VRSKLPAPIPAPRANGKAFPPGKKCLSTLPSMYPYYSTLHTCVSVSLLLQTLQGSNPRPSLVSRVRPCHAQNTQNAPEFPTGPGPPQVILRGFSSASSLLSVPLTPLCGRRSCDGVANPLPLQKRRGVDSAGWRLTSRLFGTVWSEVGDDLSQAAREYIVANDVRCGVGAPRTWDVITSPCLSLSILGPSPASQTDSPESRQARQQPTLSCLTSCLVPAWFLPSSYLVPALLACPLPQYPFLLRFFTF